MARLRSSIGVASAAIVLATGQIWATRQQITLPLRAGVTIVPVDVRVTAIDGSAVTDLSPSDFVLSEDGVRQEIRAFAKRQIAPDPALADLPLLATSRSSTDVTPQNRRIILIIVGRGPAAASIKAISKLERQALPQDQIAVSVWHRTTPFTTNHEQIAQLLDRLAEDHDQIDREIAATVPPRQRGAYDDELAIPDAVQQHIDRVIGDATGLAQDNFTRSMSVIGGLTSSEYRAKTGANLDLLAVRAAIAYLRGVDGEKHLVFIASPADPIAVIDPYRTAEEANDARVAIHFLDWGSSAAAPVAGQPRGQIGIKLDRPDLLTLGLGTAGGAYRAGDSHPAIVVDQQPAITIDNTTRFEYVLGYTPTNQALDGRFRKIVVRLNLEGNSPEIRRLITPGPQRERDVRWRAGYFAGSAPPPIDAVQVRTHKRIATAAAVDTGIEDLKLGVRATTNGSGVTAALQIETASISTGSDRGAISLTLFGYLTDADGVFLPNALTESVSLPVVRSSEGKLSLGSLIVQIPRPRFPGVIKYCKVIAYDATTDQLGSKTVTVSDR